MKIKIYGLKMISTEEDFWVKFALNSSDLKEYAEKTFYEYNKYNQSITGYEIKNLSEELRAIDFILETVNEQIEIYGGEIA